MGPYLQKEEDPAINKVLRRVIALIPAFRYAEKKTGFPTPVLSGAALLNVGKTTIKIICGRKLSWDF